MSKTILSALAAAFIAVSSMGATTGAEAGYRSYGYHGHHKTYKAHYGWRSYGHGYGYGYGHRYGKCAQWSYGGKYCVKWW